MGIRRGSISTPIIADGLVFNMDPANQASYPKTGTIVTDTINRVSSGSLESDPIFTEDIAFNYDGIDDYITVNGSTNSGLNRPGITNQITLEDNKHCLDERVAECKVEVGTLRGIPRYCLSTKYNDVARYRRFGAIDFHSKNRSCELS